MQRCTGSSVNGMSNRKLFYVTLSLIMKAAPGLLLGILCMEILVGVIQTTTLIIWKYVVNYVDQFLANEIGFGFVVCILIISFISYIFMDLFRMILESLYTFLNNFLFEYLQSILNDKCKVINIIHFEDKDLYNEVDRAYNAIGSIISLVGIGGIFVMAITRISTLGIYVFFQKPILLLLVLLPIFPITAARVIRGRDLYRLNFIQSEKRRECSYYKSNILEKETRTLLAASFFERKWKNLYGEIIKEEKKVNLKICIVYIFLNIMKAAMYLGAILLVACFLFEGTIDIGTFALIIGMLGTTHATIEVFVSRGSDIGGVSKYIKDYFGFLNRSEDMETKRESFVNEITLSKVSFKYPSSNKDILNNISLNIQKGEKLAIVGANGGGKTTLSKVILGLYNPSYGSVIYNGCLRPQNKLLDASVVFQDFCKYFFPLRENVALGNLATLNQDDKLIKKLNDFDFNIRKLNASLDSQLGREFSGIELSGGEWQKIALARGFNKESEFFVLDEPNSGLDPLIESKLFKHFIELLKDKTGIIITHRLGLAKMTDRIILLEDGKIVEEGTHSDLVNKKGKYYKLYDLQAQIYND